MKDIARIPLLFDFYGPLLTERQQELLRAYYLEDLSLGEIAQSDGVSRQAVHDLVKRAEAALVQYEELLGFARAHAGRQQRLQALAGLLGSPSPDLDQARSLTRQLLEDTD